MGQNQLTYKINKVALVLTSTNHEEEQRKLELEKDQSSLRNHANQTKRHQFVIVTEGEPTMIARGQSPMGSCRG